MVRTLSLELRKLAGRSEQAQAMVEYGLLISLIAMVGFVGVMLLGGGVQSLYNVMNTIAAYLGTYLS
jgi:Flp pilus assembly pilin Flp